MLSGVYQRIENFESGFREKRPDTTHV